MPSHAFSQMPSPPQIIAYVFPNLPGDRPLQAGDVDPARLTRINYSFALIHDGRMVESGPQDAANLRLLLSLKQAKPTLEVLVSVGGWLGSGGYSDAALTPASRKRFAESAVDFVKRYGLDGLDVDWEYPGQSGAGNRFRPEDGANFNLLLAELRSRLDRESRHSHKPLRLSIAAGASVQFLAHTALGEGQRSLDTVNLMAYDYYEAGSGTTPTGNHAPLFRDPADRQAASGADAVHAFEQAGVPAAKIVLGVPFYGHAWGNVPPENHGLFQTGTAVPGLHAGYPEVQAMLANGFTRYWDEASQVPFAYNETTRQWITYEDPESIRRKCRFVLEEHLGGMMFWQYLSDPSGVLLRSIDEGLHGQSATGAGTSGEQR